MYVRFVVEKTEGGKRTNQGLFYAAKALLGSSEILPDDRQSLEELIAWFDDILPVPNIHNHNPQAIYWYRHSPKHIKAMSELAELLKQYNYQVEMVTTEFPGPVFYTDDFQIAAVPHQDRHR